ncbi:MAG TPA: hypothetical protein VI795_02830 [Patescibacteria group bacterium]|nr:hypothetical protein [Patescibacteria group bacterium]
MAKEDDCFTCALVEFNKVADGNEGCVGKVICIKKPGEPTRRTIQATADKKEPFMHCSRVEGIDCPVSSEEDEVIYNLKN